MILEIVLGGVGIIIVLSIATYILKFIGYIGDKIFHDGSRWESGFHLIVYLTFAFAFGLLSYLVGKYFIGVFQW